MGLLRGIRERSVTEFVVSSIQWILSLSIGAGSLYLAVTGLAYPLIATGVFIGWVYMFCAGVYIMLAADRSIHDVDDPEDVFEEHKFTYTWAAIIGVVGLIGFLIAVVLAAFGSGVALGIVLFGVFGNIILGGIAMAVRKRLGIGYAGL